jgi:sec-independent protein translocase protein TatB
MFDISWGEMLLLGGVALIVIGPKDLPGVLKSAGQATAKLKRMAGEFQGQFHDAIRDADVHNISKTLRDPVDHITASVRQLSQKNPLHDIAKQVNDSFQESEKYQEPDQIPFYDPLEGIDQSLPFVHPAPKIVMRSQTERERLSHAKPKPRVTTPSKLRKAKYASIRRQGTSA